MKKSTKWTVVLKFISIIVFMFFFGVSYFCLNKGLERKDAFVKNGAFLEEENDFDVLFLGTSHMVDAVYPMELWNQYGIFSYNLAGPMNEISVSYWQLINALDYTSPKLVVLDCSRVSNMSEVVERSMNHVHKSFDFFPLSMNKIKAAYNLFNEKDRLGFLWKFSLYHSRWNELTEEDFQPEQSVEKGAQALARVAIPQEKVSLDRSEKLLSDTVGTEYLCKIIELCQESGIDILLTYLPFPAGEEDVREANTVYDIAERYGVNYINFLEMDEVVDFDTDCNDSNSHLNSSGGRKITEYLGDYIKRNYDIKDHREEVAYTSWHEDYEEYTDFKLEIIQKQTSLDSELMLLYDKNISSCIYIREGSEILQDERMVKLIKNVSPYAELTQIETAIQNKSEYFLVVDNGWCNVWESVAGQPFQDLGTTFGNVTYAATGDGNTSLFIQNSENSYIIGANESGEIPDMQVIAINRLTGEIVNKSSYKVVGYDDYGNIVANEME